MREDNRELTFSLEEELLWIIIFRMNSISCFWDGSVFLTSDWVSLIFAVLFCGI